MQIKFVSLHPQTYETVDKTNPQAREQGRQQALQENQRKLQELTAKLQQDRQNALEEAERLARLENDQNMEKLEEDMQQQRQRLAQLKAAKEKAEKEAQEEKAFLEMKESLLEYEFGSRIGQATFQELNTSDVDKVRIVLIGPTGSGKTSFIGEWIPYVVPLGRDSVLMHYASSCRIIRKWRTSSIYVIFFLQFLQSINWRKIGEVYWITNIE